MNEEPKTYTGKPVEYKIEFPSGNTLTVRDGKSAPHKNWHTKTKPDGLGTVLIRVLEDEHRPVRIASYASGRWLLDTGILLRDHQVLGWMTLERAAELLDLS